MPRLYMTPNEVLETPLGIGLSAQIAALPIGSVDKMLAKASQRCDSWCSRRLQAPGSSQLSVGANVGDAEISVKSTLTLDELAENAVLINPGAGNQEIVSITSGGVDVTNWSSPYPGMLTLQSGLLYSHSNNEPVTYLYREVSEAGGSSSSDPYTEAIQTQAMQIALAHMPSTRMALTRVIFFKAWPIISINQIEHAFSFDNQFNNIDLNVESIETELGYARFNVGQVILKEGFMRLTYSGGFVNVPGDIKDATLYYFAEAMKLMTNPFGATSMTRGKRSNSWQASKGGDTPLVAQAKEALHRYKRRYV